MSRAATAWAELAGMLTPPGIKYRSRKRSMGEKVPNKCKKISALFFAWPLLWKQWKARQNEALRRVSRSFFHSRPVDALIGPRPAGIFALAGRKHPFAGRLEALEPRPIPQR